MNRFLGAVQEALQARAGAGDLLEAVTAARIYVHEAPKNAQLPLVVIEPGAAEQAGEANYTGGYRLCRFGAAVCATVEYGRGERGDSYDGAAELLGLAERAILDNRRLVTATYGSGFIRKGDWLRAGSRWYYDDVLGGEHGGGRRVMVGRVDVNGEAILRDGDVSPE